MKTKTFVIAVLVITGVFGIVLMLNAEEENPIKEIVNSGKEILAGDETDQNNQEPPASETTPPSQENPTTSSDASSSSSNGGGSGGGGSTGGNNCEEIQISYSFTNIQSDSNCETFSGQTCTSKSLSCSVNVNNLDTTTSDDFTISFIYHNSDDRDDIVLTETQTTTILAENSASLSSVTSISGEDADKDISCIVRSVTIPTKEIC